jgi:hypothetical protein
VKWSRIGPFFSQKHRRTALHYIKKEKLDLFIMLMVAVLRNQNKYIIYSFLKQMPYSFPSPFKWATRFSGTIERCPRRKLLD